MKRRNVSIYEIEEKLYAHFVRGNWPNGHREYQPTPSSANRIQNYCNEYPHRINIEIYKNEQLIVNIE